MSKEVRKPIQNVSRIFIYLGLYGYEFIEEKNKLYLKHGNETYPLRLVDGTNGSLEYACDVNDKRIYIAMKEGKHSFCVKQNDKSLTGVSLKQDGTFEMFINEEGVKHQLTLTNDSCAFSYDEKDKNIAVKSYIGGLPKGNKEIFLDMLARVGEKIIILSIERITRTHTLLLSGEMSDGKSEFQPLVTIKGRDKSDLPSEWVDHILFPEDYVSYFKKVVEKIEEFYPGFTDFMKKYDVIFANAYSEGRHRKRKTVLQKQWPFFLENIKERYLSNKKEILGINLSLVPSTPKS